MKSLAVLGACCVSNLLVQGLHLLNGQQLEPSTNVVSLEEAYGSVPDVDEMERWDDRDPTSGRSRSARPDSYYAKRKPEYCVFPLEVVLVQDTTYSFSDDFEHMKNTQLKAMHDALRKSHPDSTYAVTTVRDIPIWSLGEPETDYCYREELSLTDDFHKIRGVYEKLESTGGGDPNEAQFKALIAAARSSTIGWKHPDASRIIVLTTDAAPHFEDDGCNEHNLPPYKGPTNDKNCAKEYYPSPEKVKQAILDRETYLVQLVYDGNYFQGGYPADAWKWFNSFIGQTSEFVAPLAQDSSNFWHLLAKLIRYIEELECLPTSSTTTHPTKSTHTTTSHGDPEPTTTSHGDPEPTTTSHGDLESTPLTSTSEDECVCPPHEVDCSCPAVKIMLRDAPVHLRLEVVNNAASLVNNS